MRKLTVVLLFAALVLGACGSNGTKQAEPAVTDATFPVTIQGPAGAVTIAKRPEKIVSLSPTATEMLFAIGAGPQVLAVDDQSDYPANAPKTKLSGYQPNVEAIAAYKPDLVVIANDVGNLMASLAKLNVPVLLEAAAKTLDDSYSQISQLGTATGRAPGAASVVSSMKADVKRLTSNAASAGASIYHELDNTYFSATSKTFIGQVYSLFGLRNIADAADKTGSGYPQLSAEYILDANPDLIFLADAQCCGVNADVVGKRPGWSRINAVTSGRVIVLDGSVASRWGPRIVGLVQQVREAASKLQPART
jgi:iron complex transport system substrate-binding protein